MKRAGHQEIHGENIAQFEFSQQGWNPFKHYVDEDQVDLLLRRRRPSSNAPEYREVQVKWCRTWPREALSKWMRPLFTHTSWRQFDNDAFANHRSGLFVAFVIPNAQQIYTGDIFMFRSQEFHELIQRAPVFKRGTTIKCFQLVCTQAGRWFLLLKRTKFSELTPQTVHEITATHRNFAVLENNP